MLVPKPTDDQTSDLRLLPEKLGEVWQIHAKRVPNHGDRLSWCVLIVSVTTNSSEADKQIISKQIIDCFPSVEVLLEILVAAMLHPEGREPSRPSWIQFQSEGYADGFRLLLTSIGVRTKLVHRLDLWERHFTTLTGKNRSPTRISLMAVPGLGLESLRKFYDSSANYIEQRPFMPANATFEVHRDGSPWYGVVRTTKDVRTTMLLVEAGIGGALENASFRELLRNYVSVGASFVSKGRVHRDDLAGIHEFGFRVAGENAYPIACRRNPGGSQRTPLAWELDMLERCLHVVPGLLLFENHSSNKGKKLDDASASAGTIVLRDE